MRKIFFLLIAVLPFAVSCGKKKQVISTGTFKDLNGIPLAYEIYTERDSFFRSISDPRNGMLYSIQKSVTQDEIMDSSFTETVFSEKGTIAQLKSFLHGRPAGEWYVWNEKGIKISFTRIVNGRPVEYQSWYDDGKLRVQGKTDASDTLVRSEYFSNGNPDRVFRVDSMGNGYCTLYFPNGKLREKGPLWQYAPSGIWNRFDSLGNTKTDTVYGMKPIE